MQRDYWYTAARDWRALEDVESVGRRAAEKAVKRLGAGKLSTRKAPVLFAPELARGLIGHFRRRDRRRGAISPQQFPARRQGRAGVPGGDQPDRAAALAGRTGFGAVRRRGRRDAGSRARGQRRARRLPARLILGAQARARDDGQCRRRAQPRRPGPHARPEDAAAEARHRPARDRDDGAGRQPGDRRLLARRRRGSGSRTARSRGPCTRSRLRETCARCSAASSPRATTSTAAARSTADRSSSKR